MVRATVVIGVLLVGMLVIAQGMRELQQVSSAGSAGNGGRVYGQATPATTLSGGGSGGNSNGGNGNGNTDGSLGNGMTSGNSRNSTGNANSSNNGIGNDGGNGNGSGGNGGTAQRTQPSLIKKDLGSANTFGYVDNRG